MSDQIILGIDPGTRTTGYGLIHVIDGSAKALDFGCIHPPKGAELATCYLIIFEGILNLIDQHSPQCLAIETQFYDKNVQSVLKLGMARGVCLAAGAKRNLSIFEYAPSKVKSAVVGHGRAKKDQVEMMIRLLLGLNQSIPEDAADALALAICHSHNCRI